MSQAFPTSDFIKLNAPGGCLYEKVEYIKNTSMIHGCVYLVEFVLEYPQDIKKTMRLTFCP